MVKMHIKKYFQKLDKVICNYLGVEREETRPEHIKTNNGKLKITNTISFKRHTVLESWENYQLTSINQTNPQNKEKLGLAAGKAVANNLVISFEEVKVVGKK